jgi:hypothetical protein
MSELATVYRPYNEIEAQDVEIGVYPAGVRGETSYLEVTYRSNMLGGI